MQVVVNLGNAEQSMVRSTRNCTLRCY